LGFTGGVGEAHGAFGTMPSARENLDARGRSMSLRYWGGTAAIQGQVGNVAMMMRGGGHCPLVEGARSAWIGSGRAVARACASFNQSCGRSSPPFLSAEVVRSLFHIASGQL